MEKQISLKDFLSGTNKKGLVDYYGKTVKTLHSWMKPHEAAIGKMAGGSFTPKQMIVIITKLGPPPKMEIPEDKMEELIQRVA
jgi:hypothetical protein